MASQFLYVGLETRGYFSYVDTATERMLVAEPGGLYGIRATAEGLPIPPGDGRWDVPAAPAAPARPARAAKAADGGE